MDFPWQKPSSELGVPHDLGNLQPYLVGGLDHFLFFHLVGNSNPNWWTHIFQRGRYTTNQTSWLAGSWWAGTGIWSSWAKIVGTCDLGSFIPPMVPNVCKCPTIKSPTIPYKKGFCGMFNLGMEFVCYRWRISTRFLFLAPDQLHKSSHLGRKMGWLLLIIPLDFCLFVWDGAAWIAFQCESWGKMTAVWPWTFTKVACHQHGCLVFGFN